MLGLPFRSCQRNAKEYLVIAWVCQGLLQKRLIKRLLTIVGKQFSILCLKHTCCKMLWAIFISVLLPTMFSQASAVTLLRNQLSDPNALCNDGSQAVYYHQQVNLLHNMNKILQYWRRKVLVACCSKFVGKYEKENLYFELAIIHALLFESSLLYFAT